MLDVIRCCKTYGRGSGVKDVFELRALEKIYLCQNSDFFPQNLFSEV